MRNNMKTKLILILASVLAVPAAILAVGNFSQLNVFPNPVRVYLGDSSLTFKNVTAPFHLRIYNSRGFLVYEARQDSGSSLVWDLKNNSGQAVASGIYVYLATDDAGERKTGKIGIIR